MELAIAIISLITALLNLTVSIIKLIKKHED